MKTELKSLKTESKNTKKELNRKFDDFQEELSNKIDEIKMATETNTKDIKENKEQIAEVTKGVAELESTAHTSEDKIEILETQIRNKNLRLRGISENFGKDNLRTEFEEVIQKILETEDSIDIDKIFRINSKIAKKKGFSRDIFVSFYSKAIRDEIFRKHRDSPLNIEEKDVIILQDLPRDTLRKRREFHFLKQILISKEIRYFWKIPFALEIRLDSGKRVIRTVAEG